MRTIKVRCWDKKEGKMIPPVGGKYNPLYLLSQSVEDDFEYMQFTGLLDKFGVEIYEGDILYYREDPQNIMEMQDIKKPVVFERGAFRIDVYDTWKKVLDDETALEGEIIGNIYENKQLLK